MDDGGRSEQCSEFEDSIMDRRDFLKAAGGSLAAASVAATPREAAAAQALSDKAKLDRIASNTYPLRQLFKTRPGGRGGGGGRGAGGQGRGGEAQTPAGAQPGSGAPAAAATPPPAAGGQAAGGRTSGPVPGRGMGGVTTEE